MYFLQVYIGPRKGKTAIVHNRDVCSEIHPGCLVAVDHPSWVGTIPQIAKIVSIPPEPSLDTCVEIGWFDEKSGTSYRDRWHRQFVYPSKNYGNTYIPIRNIILYDFELNRTGTLKKATREELKRKYQELKETVWKEALAKSRRKRF